MVDDDISCSQFYPHHFTALGDQGLNLTDGTWLEDEMQIISDEHVHFDQKVQVEIE